MQNKILASLVEPLDDVIVLGCFIRAKSDKESLGVVVDVVNEDVVVLWTTPPKFISGYFGEIW
jgi:hypothetical protein